MIWIDTQDAFEDAVKRVATQPKVAVDTEADSLHSYFDKVCLIQISIPGEDLVIDPLSKIDLAAFGRILGDERITKVLHGADYDLRILNRDFGFTISNLIDTMVCSQLLGYEAFGLAALLQRYFALTVDKSHQRADWAMRPLPRVMLEYAASDTRHLIALADQLRQELIALGRWDWAQEEFARLETIRFTEKEEEGFRRLKGISGLDRRSLAIVQALYDYRDALARALDDDADPVPRRRGLRLVTHWGHRLGSSERRRSRARRSLRSSPKAATAEALESVKALPATLRRRYGRELVRHARDAMAIPEEMLPEKGGARPWMRDKALESRVSRLKNVRDKKAKELKIDPGILAPRHVLTAIAATRDLNAVPAMRDWQKRLIGSELLNVL